MIALSRDANTATGIVNIAEILANRAVAHPNRAAIIDSYHGKNRVMTFGQLEAAVTQAAALLWKAGLRPGDRVLVFQPMSAELYVALIALFRSGLVATFIDPSAGRENIERCCALAQPQGFIGSGKAYLLRPFVPALRAIPRQFVIGRPWLPFSGAIPWSQLANLPPRHEIVADDPDAQALLTFTSGSTGQPKAMQRNHRFLLAQHRILEQNFPGKEGAVSLTTLPIFVLADLASGLTSLIAAGDLRHPGRINPAPVVEQMRTYQPMRASASPAFWERIAAYCTQHQQTLPASLKALYAGGAPVFPPLLDKLQAIASQAAITSVYGSTEAEPIAHIARTDFHRDDLSRMRLGCGLLAGPPVPEIRLRILRDQWGTAIGPYTAAEFAAECLPDGEPGEIVVSGKHVSSGYVNGAGDEETKFNVDGAIWHRTGDMGYLDAEGRLWLLGRCVGRIQDACGTLYPFAAECALSWIPEIERAAAIAHQGQRLLIVEAGRHVPMKRLRDCVAWAEFDAIHIYRHIPVDTRHNAKIDYPALRRLLEQQ